MFSLSVPVHATQVDVATASNVAANFYRQFSPAAAAPQLALASHAQLSESRGDVACFYVFNIDAGFVMVAADDKVRPVLAYSTESNFDADNIPAHIRFFLDGYRDEILAIIESPLTENAITPAMWTRLVQNGAALKDEGSPVVGPLLTTKWAQTEYYNLLCPADASAQSGGRCLVGCGAIVMGQVMHYWKHPATGTGSHSYNCPNYGVLSADFSAESYGYNAMPNKLSSSSTPSQIMSTATLLYHCGVAVDMYYGPNASVSNSNNIVPAFSTYFGYPATVEYKERSYYTDAAWLSMVKGELDERAPFLYGGSGSYGGHVWVCDGYTDEDYLHFNWGWNGSYNGYFIVGDFTPGPYDFNSSQSMIRGIRGPQVPGVGISEATVQEVRVFPNPASDVLRVEMGSEVSGDVSLTVTDLAGRILLTQQVNSFNDFVELNISRLPQGLYLLRVEGKTEKVVRKFVKK